MSSGAVTVGPQTLGAAQDALLAPCDGAEGICFTVAAGLTGTITFEASLDGVTYFPVSAYGSTAGLQAAGAFVNPAAQMFVVSAGAAVRVVRCRISAYTSGSAVVVGAVDDSGPASLVPTTLLGTAIVSQLNQATPASASQTSPFLRHRVLSAATDNPTSVKGSAGNLHYIDVTNDGAAKAFLKLYDKATAPSNADTPVSTILLPVGTNQVPVNEALLRHPFALGIGYRIVGLIADNDNTAVVAAAVALNMLYI